MPRWSVLTTTAWRYGSTWRCRRAADHLAVACAFDLLMVKGDDLRRQPLRARKLALGKLLLRSLDGLQYVEHAEGHGDRMFEAVCRLGLEGIVSKKLDAPYKSGPSKAWLKVKNPNAPAATRAIDGALFNKVSPEF